MAVKRIGSPMYDEHVVNLTPQGGGWYIAQQWSELHGVWRNIHIGSEAEIVRYLKAHGFKESELRLITWDKGGTTPPKRSPRAAADRRDRRKNPPPSRAAARRPEYLAKYGKKSQRFHAKDDGAALRYANGLLAHKIGGGKKPSSLARTGRAESKA